MRFQASVTTVSWIPSESVPGMGKMVFASGVGHYDDPPPDTLGDLEALRRADRFRFAHHLAGWIEVTDDRVVHAGYQPDSGLTMGSTLLWVLARGVSFPAVAFPILRREPEITETSARFVQTVGGHTAVPIPRRISAAPFVKLQAPIVWTTLALTAHADGSAEFELVGASPFPRHWVYDAEGRLAAKAGLIDYKQWALHASPRHTPWGDEDTPALLTTVETALERTLSHQIMRGAQRPELRRLAQGALLTEQGAGGGERFLLLDGILSVEVDGCPVAEVGPGAILGERALLEGGTRTSTLRAVTPVRVAVARPEDIDRDVLEQISRGHRREERHQDPT
jgi:hypothetical protein